MPFFYNYVTFLPVFCRIPANLRNTAPNSAEFLHAHELRRHPAGNIPRPAPTQPTQRPRIPASLDQHQHPTPSRHKAEPAKSSSNRGIVVIFTTIQTFLSASVKFRLRLCSITLAQFLAPCYHWSITNSASDKQTITSNPAPEL